MSVLTEVLEITLKLLKNSSDDVARHGDNLMAMLGKSTHASNLPAILLVFCLSLAAAAALLMAMSAAHIGLRMLFRKKGKVFISYFHRDQSLAAELLARLQHAGLSVVMLPFSEAPKHDDLLENIKREVLACDVFLCVPGGNPSFVENEVMMAFSLDKPQVFIVGAGGTARLPNTAKKGFPVFDLTPSQQENFSTVALFCSYISRDKRATLRFYGLLLKYLGSCAALIGALFAVSIAAGTRFRPTELAACRLDQIGHGACGIFWWYFGVTLVAVLLPWLIFFAINLMFRARAVKSIAGRSFKSAFLPKYLDYSLTRDRLLAVLLAADPLAQHETANAPAG